MKTKVKQIVKAVSLIMAVLIVMPIETAERNEVLIRSAIAAVLVAVCVALVVIDALKEERSWRRMDAQIMRDRDRENSRSSMPCLQHSSSQRNMEMFRASNTDVKTGSNGSRLSVTSPSRELYASQDIQVLRW